MAKRFLEDGDEVVADFVHFTIGANGELEKPLLGDAEFWHDGESAFKDDDGRFYVEDD
jgi:hypothetical protein